MKIPVLRLGNILLTSFQDGLTDRDAIELQNDLLEMAAASETEGVVIDVTALETVDTYLARMLNETAQMARVQGCDVMLTGVQPAVAMTLIELGNDIIQVETAVNLESGLEKLKKTIMLRNDLKARNRQTRNRITRSRRRQGRR